MRITPIAMSNVSSRRVKHVCIIASWIYNRNQVEMTGYKEVRIRFRAPVAGTTSRTFHTATLPGYIRAPAGSRRLIRKLSFVQFGRDEHPKTHQPVNHTSASFTWSTRLLTTGRENVDEEVPVRSVTVYRGYYFYMVFFDFFNLYLTILFLFAVPLLFGLIDYLANRLLRCHFWYIWNDNKVYENITFVLVRIRCSVFENLNSLRVLRLFKWFFNENIWICRNFRIYLSNLVIETNLI